MVRIAAVANLKGGTGKSTIAVNLACELASGGVAVSLVDADEQGTATYWIERGGYPVTLKPAAPGADPAAWAAEVAALSSDFVVIDAPPQPGRNRLHISRLKPRPRHAPSVARSRARASSLHLPNLRWPSPCRRPAHQPFRRPRM